MLLSDASRSVMLSIFKGERNARRELDWKEFNKAMSELGFKITQDGVMFTYVVPRRWGGGALVLHMDHEHKARNNKQNYLKTRLLRTLGWDKTMFVSGVVL